MIKGRSFTGAMTNGPLCSGTLICVAPVLETFEDPDPEAVQRLVRRLVDWNTGVAPPEDHRKLAVLAHDVGNLVGGASGYTHWGWLFVSHLWVADDLRGHGLGSRLMHEIETAALRRGASMAHLDTYDFQARSFYERLLVTNSSRNCGTTHSAIHGTSSRSSWRNPSTVTAVPLGDASRIVPMSVLRPC